MASVATFNYTGGAQTFTVPAGITSITVVCQGACGGGDPRNAGGISTLTIPVTAADVVNVYVGGLGGIGGSGPSAVGGTGGYNGGGTGGPLGTQTGFQAGFGGGGASDVRLGGTALSNRIVVAPGGGGSTGRNINQGGTGGGTTGSPGLGGNGGGGGTASAGGAGGNGYTAGNGASGTGGTMAVQNTSFDGSGGGGGGYFGGGCGSWGGSFVNVSGGGGGSAFLATTAPRGSTSAGSTVAGGGSVSNGVVQVFYDFAPTPPTLISPVGSAGVDYSSPSSFSATFNDADDVTCGQVDIRIRTPNGTGTFTTQTNAAFTQSGSTVTVVEPANNFTNGSTYGWEMQTYDVTGLASGWSSEGVFVATTPPTLPLISAPTAGQAVTSLASTPIVFNLQSGQTDYQARRVADDGHGNALVTTVYEDSGDQASTTVHQWTFTNTTVHVSGAEHWQARVKKSGTWSNWADVAVVSNISPPNTPTVSASVNTSTQSVTVTATITTGGKVPVALQVWASYDGGSTYWLMWQILTGAGAWAITDWYPPLNIPVSYQSRVVATDGTFAWSG